jgi:hypothetical protein
MGKPAYSDLFVGSVTRSRIVTISVPVFRDEQVIYEMSFNVPLSLFQRIITQQQPSADWTMSIFDRQAGYVTLLTDARYDASSDHWSASGASVTYLDSNGLDVRTGRSDDPRNRGTHRGNNGADSVIRWDMVRAGVLEERLGDHAGALDEHLTVHRLDRGNATAAAGVVRLRRGPSTRRPGSNGGAGHRRPADLRHGLGDSGGSTAVKLEDTTSEGRGRLDVTTDDLRGLPPSPAYWTCRRGHDPSVTGNYRLAQPPGEVVCGRREPVPAPGIDSRSETTAGRCREGNQDQGYPEEPAPAGQEHREPR